MPVQTSILDLHTFRHAELKKDPFPYLVVKNFLKKEKLEAIRNDFPEITQGGSFPLSDLRYGKHFQELIDELEGIRFREAVETKFSIDLTGRPTMITLRGISRKNRDGKIHTDSKSKLLTFLIYMNPNWGEKTGNLRILKNGQNLDDYAEEISCSEGTLVAFQVTENCWHGYPSFDGIRKSIQLNFISSTEEGNKQLSRHSFAAKLKKLLGMK